MTTKTLPASSFPGTQRKGLGLPGTLRSALTMHCLWSWVTAKASRGTASPPVVLREARGLDQPGLEGCEVGAGVWGQAAFLGVLGMGIVVCALRPCFANCRSRPEKSAFRGRM